MIALFCVVLGGLGLGFALAAWAIRPTLRCLHKELKVVREDLWETTVEKNRAVDAFHGLRRQQRPVGLVRSNVANWAWNTTTPKVPHRDHSDVLHINSIDDLIEGTKP
jgi:hypothetical protein